MRGEGTFDTLELCCTVEGDEQDLASKMLLRRRQPLSTLTHHSAGEHVYGGMFISLPPLVPLVVCYHVVFEYLLEKTSSAFLYSIVEARLSAQSRVFRRVLGVVARS